MVATLKAAEHIAEMVETHPTATCSDVVVAECVISLRLYYFSALRFYYCSAGVAASQFAAIAADNAVSSETAVAVAGGEQVAAFLVSAFDLETFWEIPHSPCYFLHHSVESQICFECSASLNFGQEYLAWSTVICQCQVIVIHQQNLVLQVKRHYCGCSD